MPPSTRPLFLFLFVLSLLSVLLFPSSVHTVAFQLPSIRSFFRYIIENTAASKGADETRTEREREGDASETEQSFFNAQRRAERLDTADTVCTTLRKSFARGRASDLHNSR